MPDQPKEQRTAEVTAEVTEQFAQLDAAAAAEPGLDALLRVYGGYESAVRQADRFFTLLNQAPSFTTSNSSGS